MNLQEVEQALQERLTYLQKRHDEGFERPSWEAWLECYRTLAQVKQAQATERIARTMEGWGRTGFPIERIS
jgi:hypothetical protein